MKRSVNTLSITLFFADIFWVIFGIYVSKQLRIYLPFGGAFTFLDTRFPLRLYFIAVFCWSMSLFLLECYNPQKVLRVTDEILRVLSASFLASLLFAGLVYFTYRDISRYQFIYFSLAATGLLLFYRLLLRILYKVHARGNRLDKRSVLVVGAGELGVRVANILIKQSRWGYELVGLLDDDPLKMGWQPDGLEGKKVLGEVDQLKEMVTEHRITDVFIALPTRADKKLKNVVASLQAQAIRIMIVPDYFSLALVHARTDVMEGLPVIHLRAPVIDGANRIIKRLFDITVSAILILMIWPVLLVIAILIRLDSPGLSIFKQHRVGENGEIFLMYKFRTMVEGAEDDQEELNEYDMNGNLIHKHPDDPRITRLGRFLRRTSLDELPQLFNVIKGDMSLVGPRPEMPWLVDKYETWQRKRFAVPQGITGWWQVNKREGGVMHLDTKEDLYYVYNYSFWLDIKILLMTFKALFRGY